ncbi:MAG: MGMT family protein [Patescibacteria group bacterium]
MRFKKHKNKKAPRYSFAEAVYGVVRKIPKGETMTYGEVATKAGSPNAARAVGNILSKNWDPKVPCHRVIRKNGGLGGYNRGLKLKGEILSREKSHASK